MDIDIEYVLRAEHSPAGMRKRSAQVGMPSFTQMLEFAAENDVVVIRISVTTMLRRPPEHCDVLRTLSARRLRFVDIMSLKVHAINAAMQAYVLRQILAVYVTGTRAGRDDAVAWTSAGGAPEESGPAQVWIERLLGADSVSVDDVTRVFAANKESFSKTPGGAKYDAETERRVARRDEQLAIARAGEQLEVQMTVHAGTKRDLDAYAKAQVDYIEGETKAITRHGTVNKFVNGEFVELRPGYAERLEEAGESKKMLLLEVDDAKGQLAESEQRHREQIKSNVRRIHAAKVRIAEEQAAASTEQGFADAEETRRDRLDEEIVALVDRNEVLYGGLAKVSGLVIARITA